MGTESCLCTRIDPIMFFGLSLKQTDPAQPSFYPPTTKILGKMTRIRIRPIELKPYNALFKYDPKVEFAFDSHDRNEDVKRSCRVRYVKTLDPHSSAMGRHFSMGGVRSNRVFNIEDPSEVFWCSSTELQELTGHEEMEAQMILNKTLSSSCYGKG